MQFLRRFFEKVVVGVVEGSFRVNKNIKLFDENYDDDDGDDGNCGDATKISCSCLQNSILATFNEF